MNSKMGLKKQNSEEAEGREWREMMTFETAVERGNRVRIYAIDQK